jgi:hypothetical protein
MIKKLIQIGRYSLTEKMWEKNTVMRISGQPTAIQIMVDKNNCRM